jgi:Ankyrin repeats (3 copies)/Ankyrin repeat
MWKFQGSNGKLRTCQFLVKELFPRHESKGMTGAPLQFMKCRTIFLILLPPIALCWWFVIPNLYRFHPLYKAIIRGDMAALQSRLREHPDEISYNNGLIGFAATPLDLAAEQNDTNMIAFLLDRGAAIEDKQGYRDQCTALHCAAARGNIAAITFLLLRGANVNSLDRDNETPLHYAAEHDHARAITYLVTHGANLNAKSIYGETPLENAVKDERVQAVQALLEQGADADFDKLIVCVKSQMNSAPLASQARHDQWLKTIAVLVKYKQKRQVH